MKRLWLVVVAVCLLAGVAATRAGAASSEKESKASSDKEKGKEGTKSKAGKTVKTIDIDDNGHGNGTAQDQTIHRATETASWHNKFNNKKCYVYFSPFSGAAVGINPGATSTPLAIDPAVPNGKYDYSINCVQFPLKHGKPPKKPEGKPSDPAIIVS